MVAAMPRPVLQIICLLVCPVLFGMMGSCSSVSLKKQTMADDRLRKEILSTVDSLYPDRFKAVHRVILTLFGKDYVLNGYLSVDRARNDLRVVAQSELGGDVFDVHYTGGGQARIVSRIGRIKNRHLEKTMVRDLRVLYLLKRKDLERGSLFRDQDGSPVLSVRNDGADILLYFQKGVSDRTWRLRQINMAENGKTDYMIRLEYGKNQKTGKYPSRIFVTDPAMHYSLNISVSYLM